MCMTFERVCLYPLVSKYLCPLNWLNPSWLWCVDSNKVSWDWNYKTVIILFLHQMVVLCNRIGGCYNYIVSVWTVGLGFNADSRFTMPLVIKPKRPHFIAWLGVCVLGGTRVEMARVRIIMRQTWFLGTIPWLLHNEKSLQQILSAVKILILSAVNY